MAITTITPINILVTTDSVSLLRAYIKYKSIHAHIYSYHHLHLVDKFLKKKSLFFITLQLIKTGFVAAILLYDYIFAYRLIKRHCIFINIIIIITNLYFGIELISFQTVYERKSMIID